MNKKAILTFNTVLQQKLKHIIRHSDDLFFPDV